MAGLPGSFGRVLRLPDLRILAITAAGVAVFGVVDGSLWKTLFTPTIAYRPAILFGLTLVFGWRGFVWSQLVFLISFAAFMGWGGVVLVTPLYTVSHAIAFVVARRLSKNQPWLSSQRSTLGFLAGAGLAPAISALLANALLPLIGIGVGPGVPAALDNWLRGTAAILALAPALLLYCAAPMRRWAGLPSGDETAERITGRNVLELSAEMVVWTAALWASVLFKERYGLNITYLTFLAPLSLTLFRGMGLATWALVANAIIATTLWKQLHWVGALSALDLRLLLAVYSLTILVLAAVVEERQRGRGQLTKLLKAEAALRDSEEQFRLAVKATNDAIWDLDLRTGNVTWNETHSTLYGLAAGENGFQFWSDAIHPEDRVRVVNSFNAAVRAGASSWSAEYRFRRVDGKWAFIYDRGYIARDASGVARRAIGAMQDLTERKHAEAAVRESEERFRRVFEEGPLGIVLVGRDYRFLKANNAFCQLVGYSQEEVTRRTFAEITHPDDLGEEVEIAGRLFSGEIPFIRKQKRYVRSNGEIIWVNLTRAIVRGQNGEPLYGIAMAEDITEAKRTQEESLARQKLESVGTLAGGIAHDFNNILGAVQAQSEMALSELNEGSSCKEELNAIREVAIRGSEIVRQLMIYAGKENSAIERADLSKTVDEMLALLKVSVTKHAAIRADLGRDLPGIRASAGQLRQIVMNLITNASDAVGQRDGVIEVITSRVTVTGNSAAASFTSLPDGDYVQLEVSDTGCGMSRETLAQVFDPFYTTKSAGRGLGLAVVQGIVRSLGGTIRLTSELNKGSTFQVLLPCAETPPCESGTAVPGAVDPPVRSQQGNILVVEDEDLLRKAVVKMLRKTGFQVFEAADGTSAVDLLRARGAGIDAILLDMTLPGASSQDIVAEAANARPDVTVILTSAYSREMIDGTIRAPQIRSFIRKPYQFEDLLKTLKRELSSNHGEPVT
jgi:PAS domain S-box-containing protein